MPTSRPAALFEERLLIGDHLCEVTPKKRGAFCCPSCTVPSSTHVRQPTTGATVGRQEAATRSGHFRDTTRARLPLVLTDLGER